jgi:hypothetical protein
MVGRFRFAVLHIVFAVGERERQTRAYRGRNASGTFGLRSWQGDMKQRSNCIGLEEH